LPFSPVWKGYLKLSLVSCPITMFPTSSSSERVSFRQINKTPATGQQLVDSVTGDDVESPDRGRDYEIGRSSSFFAACRLSSYGHAANSKYQWESALRREERDMGWVIAIAILASLFGLSAVAQSSCATKAVSKDGKPLSGAA
jgi:hypothetical protein